MKINHGMAGMKSWALLVGAGALLLIAAASQTSLSVAVIDPDRVRTESVTVKAEMEKLAAPARDMLAEMQQKQAALSKAIEEFGRQRTALSEDKVRQRTAELQKQAQEVQALSQKLKERMEKAQAEGLNPMRQRVGNAVGEVARARGIKLVLTQSSVIYNTADLDLTGEVVARLDGGAK